MNKFSVDNGASAVLMALLLLVMANAFVDVIYPTGRNVPRREASLDAPAPDTTALGLLTGADPARGERLAKKCEICHSLKEGGGSKIGPELYGVIGRKIASIPEFTYSKALRGKGGEWTFEKLDAWIQSPHEESPDSKMKFVGMFTPQDRADLLAFLRTLSSKPEPLPGVPASQPGQETAPPAKKPAEPATGPTGGIEPQDEPQDEETAPALTEPDETWIIIVETPGPQGRTGGA